MPEKPLLEQIASSFSKFKSSPLTYIVFLIVIGYAYTMYSNNKAKDANLQKCEDDRTRLYQRLENIALKVDEMDKKDSLIEKTK